MGSITLEASNDNGASWASIWNSSGNLGNSWQFASVSLSAYVGGGVQLRFNRLIGGTWRADIAIDNISLTANGSSKDSRNETLSNTNVFELKVYPVPVKSELNISLLGFEAKTFKIRNLIGQSVLKGRFSNTINVLDLRADVYILQLYSGDAVKAQRFIKE